MAVIVAMGGQALGIALARQDAAHDPKSGLPGEIGEHGVELEVHLGQGLLHAVNAGRRFLHQGLALALMKERNGTIAAAGRKLARNSPTLWSSRSHSQSLTSLLRPGTLCTSRALTSTTCKPRCSRIS